MADPFRVWVPVLAQRILSPNGARGEAHQAVSAAKQELLTDTYHAALAVAPQAELPRFAKAIVSFIYRHTCKRPRDGLYRPTDPSNLGGDVIKAPMDALVALSIIPDDSYRYVDLVTLRIEKVEELRDEGFEIIVREANDVR
ncbi:hypothetical protein LCGC14_1768960 [marine sediment metagenome]|uniref:Uncharacterized protein n=1 Tax=marine sediment metagenome TaxID=412755 RepID=A0A0F9GYW2_9ZZZZ